MTTITAISSPEDLSEPVAMDDLPVTMLEGKADEMAVTLREFLTEQRTIIDAELSQDMRSVLFLSDQIARKQAMITMIDEQLAESAQPVEPGVEVQS